MVDFMLKERYGYEDLEKIVRILRAPGGCPWDGEQTHASIRRDFLEEAYEACEAIDEDSPTHLCEELGDVLLQVIFHADIEREAGRFTMEDVLTGVCQKLIFRHPHVFGEAHAGTSAEVLAAWDDLKRQEKQQATHTAALDSVARSLPALWRAEKLLKKAQKAGVGLTQAQSLAALQDAAGRLQAQPEQALGQLLLAAVAFGREAGVDCEMALTDASNGLLARFAEAEQAGALSTLTPDQQAALLTGREP